MEKIRLQKYFTDCGIMSRRAAEAEISQGKVKVNGVVADIGSKIDPENDIVEYKERVVRRKNNAHRYIMLNKPRGIVTTSSDEKGRACVISLVRDVGVRVYPIGRLDMDSQGLLLLTDDGELANKLTHPRHEIPKIYRVTVSTPVSEAQLNALRSRIVIDGYNILPVEVNLISPTVMIMTLYEGRNRQIRKMCESQNLKITELCRIAIGKIELGSLPLGKWRELDEEEVRYLKG